jgi:nitrite reductase/ring-hydroxylating ferredoxin subunit
MADTETDADTALTARDETERGARRKGLGLSGLALVGVILFSVTFAGIVTAVFLLPPEHLRIPELQPAVRVAHETDFPVGASRIVAWGDEPILVVRGSERFWAVQGTSPFDGCILRWEVESLRVVSPCTYVVYDLRGNVVSGLSLIPLKPFTAFVRRGTVYVTG